MREGWGERDRHMREGGGRERERDRHMREGRRERETHEGGGRERDRHMRETDKHNHLEDNINVAVLFTQMLYLYLMHFNT